MNRIITGLTLSILLSACGQSTPPENVTAAEPADAGAAITEKYSGVLSENINPDIRPGDDFNAYVNGTWMDSAEIPADRASNTVGLEVHEQATENVRIIIEESADGDFAKGSDEQKVGDL